MPPFIGRKRRASTPPTVERMPKKAKGTPRTPVKQPDTPSARETKKFLDSLGGSDDSALSDIDSDDFEDVLPRSGTKPGDASEEDETTEWEDAMHAKAQPDLQTPFASHVTEDLELTLGGPAEQASFVDVKKKGPSKIERHIRISTHCMHVQFLMFHNTLRNAWACDTKVHETLLAQLPPEIKEVVETWRRDCGDSLQPSARIKKSPQKGKGRQKIGKGQKQRKQRDWGGDAERLEEGVPNVSRADPILRLLKYLAKYWNKVFKITAPGLRKHGYKPVRTLQEEILSFHNDSHDPEEHGERISSVRMFRDCAKRRAGSRDVGAQLFTALVRSLGIEARLVANLQPIGFGWNKNEEALPRKKKEVKEPVESSSESEEDKLEVGSFEAESKISVSRAKPKKPPGRAEKPTKYSLRNGTQEMPVDLSSSSELSDVPSESGESVIDITPQRKPPTRKYDRDLHFPVYWTEVVSPITFKVYPVDPILMLGAPATNDEQLAMFEPRGSKADKAKQVLAYVVAHSPDGTAKDVTTRYLKRHMWPGKTKGVRLPPEKVPIHNKKGKIKRYEEYDWFKTVMSSYKRPDRLRTQVDDIEEASELQPAKLEKKPVKEGEESLQWYKQSADYVLERFLRREEALVPGAESVRTFKNGKGDNAKEDPVFLRKDVVSCKTEESWHKEGRQPKSDAEPLKRVPIRAVTLTRKREIEDYARQNNGVKPTQGLYAKNQTEWIIPPPIENGVIPKNQYGNIDCFVPSMIPKGAVHVPLRSTVRVCKKLGIDYAEAVIGFEFGNKLAVPVIEGVIVAIENEHALIDAWEEEEAIRQMKEDEKRQKLILSTWRKYLMGLRILARMRDDYRDDPNAYIKEAMNPFTNPNKMSASESQPEAEMSGGFLREEENEAGEASELEIIEPQKDGPDTSMGGGFVTDTPEEPTDQVFDNSHVDSASSGLSSEDEMADKPKLSASEDDKEVEEPPSKPVRKRVAAKEDPVKSKVQPKVQAASRRRSTRKSAVKSQYFESSSDKDDDQEDIDVEEADEEDEYEYLPPVKANTKGSKRGKGKEAIPVTTKPEAKASTTIQKGRGRGRPRKPI